MAMQVTVDGVDVSAYVISYSAEDSIEEMVDSAQVLLDFRVLSIVSNFRGKTILITEGLVSATERYIFRGYIRGVNNKTVTIELDCKNKLQRLEDREVTASFDRDIDTEAGVISEIALTLITAEEFGGLNANSSTVQDSGSELTIKQFICNADTVLERLNVLADVIGYQLYYKASDDLVYFEEIGRTTSDVVLRFNLTGTTNILDIPKYDEDASSIVTRVNVNGAKQLQTFTESFNGDGSTTQFSLTYTPTENTKVTVGSSVKTRYQLDGVSSSGDYYVDVVNNRIIFNTAPSSGTNNVVVEYTTLRPTQVQEVNEDAETEYLDGDYVEQTFTFTDLQSVDDARNRAKALLDTLSAPLRSLIVKVSKSVGAVYPGERVRVIDDVNGIDEYFIVRSVERKYPDPYDEISLGDDRLYKKPTLSDVNERLLKLEKEILQNTGILVQTRRSEKTLTIDLMQSDVYTESTTGTIWGTGLWGSGVWNVNGFGERVLTRRVWPNDVFWYDGVDTNLIDTGNTDATIDTAAQELRADT